MLPVRPIIVTIFYCLLFSHHIPLATGLDLLSLMRRSPERTDWDGRWFPHSPQSEDHNPLASQRQSAHLYDARHGVKMGVVDPRCDDANTNLTVDWNMSPQNYSCFSFEEKLKYRSRDDVPPLYAAEHIPHGYSAPHRCMYDKITYDEIIPTFGTHRPLWAKYGEYTFLPRQRWIHNLEHGAIVMLYHPCADKNEINLLRKIVNKCLYRHIITPYNLLTPDRPIALVSWGHRLLMSKVDPNIVMQFIKDHALKGPEQTSRDGQYDLMLSQHAEIVSDIDDIELCRSFDFSKITM